MKPETIQALNNLNKDYYERASVFWNHNHDNWWEGWYRFDFSRRLGGPSCYSKLLLDLGINSKILDTKDFKISDEFKDYFKKVSTGEKGSFLKEVSILDIGCGTGKLATMAKNSFPENIKINYTGVDFSIKMLEISKQIQSEFKNFELVEYDLISRDLDDIFNFKVSKKSFKFQIVALIGFLHHVPSFQKRAYILEKISEFVASGGILIWSTFEYLNSPRLSKRIIKKDDFLTKWAEDNFKFNYEDLEKNDHLLGWVKKTEAVRYSHYFDDQEINKLHSLLPDFQIIDDYYADGKNGKQNRYFILKKN